MNDEPLNRPEGREEPPGRAMARIARIVGDTVDQAIAEHEQKCRCRQSPVTDETAALRLLQRIGNAMEQAIREAIAEHERVFHGKRPPPETHP